MVMVSWERKGMLDNCLRSSVVPHHLVLARFFPLQNYSKMDHTFQVWLSVDLNDDFRPVHIVSAEK